MSVGKQPSGERRLARLARQRARAASGEETPPKRLGRKARRKQRQEQAIERSAAV